MRLHCSYRQFILKLKAQIPEGAYNFRVFCAIDTTNKDSKWKWQVEEIPTNQMPSFSDSENHYLPYNIAHKLATVLNERHIEFSP